MGKIALAAALLLVASLQAAPAASNRCFSAADKEAEQAIVFQTNLMVISSACHNEAYALFRYHNKDAIIGYQRAMIAHFRRAGYRNATGEFDRWNTSLANQISLQQGATSTAQICQQAAQLLKVATTLDTKGFRAYAVAHAKTAVDGHPNCRR